jgi:uncharacterized repeat protein (TIGR03899 family)
MSAELTGNLAELTAFQPFTVQRISSYWLKCTQGMMMSVVMPLKSCWSASTIRLSNQNGTKQFLVKTLGILKQLTQKDAQIFRHAVDLASKRKCESTPKILLGYYQKTNLWSFFSSKKEHRLNFAEFGLGYPDILSLMDLSLIHHSEIESGELPLDISTEWRCAGQTLYLTTKRKGTILVYYKFTTTGAELCKLVTRKQQDAYVKSLKNTLSNAFNLV